MSLDKLKQETERLLSCDIFQFNKTRKDYEYFPTYIKELLDEYNTALEDKEFWQAFLSVHFPNNQEQWSDHISFTQLISDFSRNICACLDFYYKGKVHLAYNSLNEGLVKSIRYPKSKLFEKAITSYEPATFCAYRIRNNSETLKNSAVSRAQMFHIPFEHRGKVTTQRFSIPGHPSLYLGESIFVCWKELDEPRIEEIYASRFSNNKKLNVIEIKSLVDLKKSLNASPIEPWDYSNELFRYLLMFPLNIACSIKTKNRNDNFKPEYILPQLFLQFVMEHNDQIDGIRYYSTKTDPEKLDNVPFCNLVFPTKTVHQSGYCNTLNSKFCLTEPVLWAHEIINTGNAIFSGTRPRPDVRIELINGRRVPYDWTTFKAIEKVLGFQTMALRSVVEQEQPYLEL